MALIAGAQPAGQAAYITGAHGAPQRRQMASVSRETKIGGKHVVCVPIAPCSHSGARLQMEEPIAMIGDNRNARDWAMEDVMADGNRHFEHRYFTIRERVDLGEVKMHWISGKDNPADIMTKAVDKATIDRLLPYLSGDKEIPLPDGLKIWFGPYGNAEYRANRA